MRVMMERQDRIWLVSNRSELDWPPCWPDDISGSRWPGARDRAYAFVISRREKGLGRTGSQGCGMVPRFLGSWARGAPEISPV